MNQYPYVTPVSWNGNQVVVYRVALSPDNTLVIPASRFPLSVSYHGDSTILLGKEGSWVSGQVERPGIESLVKAANDKVAVG